MAIKLYYARKSGSLAARILIHELSLNCEFIAVNQKTHLTEHKEDFLAINPKGRLPTLITDDNKILTESQVILQYLADQYELQYDLPNLLPPIENFQRYQILEWVSFIRVDLHQNYSILANSSISEELKENYFKPLFISKLKFPENALENKKYLINDNFTIADCHLFAILTWLKDLKIPISDFPNLEKYFKYLKERPSIDLSLQEKNLKF